MAGRVDDHVTVDITIEAARVTRAGFGLLNIMGTSATFPEPFRLYNDIDGVGEDFVSTDAEFIAATKAFSQTLSPPQIMISKRTPNAVQVDTITVDTVIDSTLYTYTIDGTDYTFTSGVATTDALISAGLVAAITETGITPADLAGSFTVTSDLAGDGFSSQVDVNMSIVNTDLNVNLATNLDDLIDVSGGNNWYALNITKIGDSASQRQDIKDGALWVQTQTKIFVTTSDAASILTSATDDIASFLQSQAYTRTLLFYTADVDDYKESAICGLQLPKDPGSTNWKFQIVTAITVDDLNATERSFVIAKNANLMELVGGVNITSTAMVVSSGEYIDIIRGTDWLKARISEDVFALMVSQEKISYTNVDLAKFESAIQNRLTDGEDIGLLVPGSTSVFVPLVDDISSADKLARCLNDVTFAGDLQGAVNKIAIKGTLTI